MLSCRRTPLQFIGELVKGQSLWSVLAIFCGLVLVGTTFISHTVGAMVILPIVQAVGDQMPGNHSKLLVMGAALMCSGRRGYRGEAGRGGGGVTDVGRGGSGRRTVWG
jgi:hypothetical protein